MKMTDFYETHREQHPTCTYGNKPHFVGPSVGQIGFFLCDPPEDLTNHTRCQAPFDHDHDDHFDGDQYLHETGRKS